MNQRIKDVLKRTLDFLENEKSIDILDGSGYYLHDLVESLLDDIKRDEITNAYIEDYKYHSSFDLVEALKNNDRFSFICEIQHTTELRKLLDQNWDVDYFMRILHNYILD